MSDSALVNSGVLLKGTWAAVMELTSLGSVTGIALILISSLSFVNVGTLTMSHCVSLQSTRLAHLTGSVTARQTHNLYRGRGKMRGGERQRESFWSLCVFL